MLEASLPLLKSDLCVYTAATLLFSLHSNTGVTTSYSTVLHCPGAHSSNCVKFVKLVLGMHVLTSVVMQERVRAFEFVCIALDMNCLLYVRSQMELREAQTLI